MRLLPNWATAFLFACMAIAVTCFGIAMLGMPEQLKGGIITRMDMQTGKIGALEERVRVIEQEISNLHKVSIDWEATRQYYYDVWKKNYTSDIRKRKLEEKAVH